MSEDYRQNSNRLRDYLQDLEANMDPVSAAKQAFGNLPELQDRLESYVNHMTFSFFYAKTRTEVADQSFTGHELTPAQADALRGDCMVYDGNLQGARQTLARALAEDPRNGPAAASMGFLEFQQRHLAEAQKWFTQAIQLDSQSYLAQYYYAMMQLRGASTERLGDDVGDSLRKAIALNPQFAPAYNALAQFYLSRDENLDEAHLMALRAVSLDPGEVFYYLTAASVLLRLRQADNAVRVSEKALAMAKKPEELTAAQTMLASAQRYQAYLQSVERTKQQMAAINAEQGSGSSEGGEAGTAGGELPPPVLRRRDGTPVTPPGEIGSDQISFRSDPGERGERDMLIGTIRDVKCSLPAVMQLTLTAGRQSVVLFSANFYSVSYFALDYTPQGELHPCQDLKGHKAQVFFYDLKGKPDQGELISVRLRK
jgi:tetratricopeptide (TPR) repeat protein